MNIYLGPEYIVNFNEYMDNYGGKRIKFILDAVNYWMSVHGQDSELKLQS